jgi:hypothetical protein
MQHKLKVSRFGWIGKAAALRRAGGRKGSLNFRPDLWMQQCMSGIANCGR